MDFTKELNKYQIAAVSYIDGPSLVIAGAGSGKTRVLTYKIAYLISKGLPPNRILALTFTNKAAKEMKSRIDLLLGAEKSKYIWMNTFHSVFSKFLRKEAESIGFTSNFTINDSEDTINFLKGLIKDMNLDPKKYEVKKMAHRISMCKNNLISPDNYDKIPDFVEYDKYFEIPYFSLLYKTYFTRCRSLNIMDFDDLLLYMFIMLDMRPDLLEKYQNMFDFILVDEYQDTNLLQYHILKKLAAKHHRISVVGDDSQSIYSFRNARIENILNFKKDYPESKEFKLVQNYRSSQNIVNISNLLIEKNKNRIPKTIYSENEEGSKINYQSFFSDKEEAAFLTSKILELKEKYNSKYSDFAVLYRMNFQSRVIEEYLLKNNIPYKIYSGYSFYQRKEVKDALAYLRFIVNYKDIEAFNRIINYPSRKIGETTINKLRSFALQNDISIGEVLLDENLKKLDINSATVTRIAEFRDFIDAYRQQIELVDAFTIAKGVLEESGFIDLLQSDDSSDGRSRYENLIELLNSIKEFCDFMQSSDIAESNDLIHYLETISVLTNIEENDNDDDCVALMTVHSAKGLEFTNVFIVGMEQNVFPCCHDNSLKELEEERRLFYVAITRAKQNLFISRAENKYYFGSTRMFDESIFIEDIRSVYLADNSFSIRKDIFSIFKNIEEEQEYSYKNTYKIEKSTTKKLISIKDMENSNRKRYDNSNLFVNAKVYHEKFGNGIVVSLSDDRAVISFDGEEKILLRKFAKLEIIK